MRTTTCSRTTATIWTFGNFGHGHAYLAQLLVALNLLAFLFHTVLDLCDATRQHVRTLLGTRQTFFHDLQALTRYWFFASWQDLLDFMAPQFQAEHPPA